MSTKNNIVGGKIMNSINNKGNIKGRSFFVTVQKANLLNAGLTEEQIEKPEFVAKFLTDTWNSSGKGRTSAVTVCLSKEGLYHAHAALYSENSTTFNQVRTIMFNSHVELQKGGKSELAKYMLKEPPYEEKGEIILFSMGIENIKNVQGSRTDLEEIEKLIEAGYTPQEIFNTDFKYRKYSNLIYEAFIDYKLHKSPPVKEIYVEYHFGDTGTGKSFYYTHLCSEYAKSDIYFAKDDKSGVFDNYTKSGAPKIVFLDEFKGQMGFSEILGVLDIYPTAQIHARYNNAYCLWERVYITSIFPPEKVYTSMNPSASSHVNKLERVEQLLRRIDVVVYHYKNSNGEYKMLKIPMSEYKGINSILHKVREIENE